MKNILKPWTRAAFELIAHAEIHLRKGGDFDRRMAHIGFDNAIEVAITTYLGLNPIQREGKTYKRDDVQKWLTNYHTKLEFLAEEAKARGWALKVPNDEVIFYHDIRNTQYHSGGPGVPEADHLAALRTAALDVFSMLFGIDEPEQLLEQHLQEQAAVQEKRPLRNNTIDKLLDMMDEPVVIAGRPYAASEALLAIDPDAYHEMVAAMSESRNILPELHQKYPEYLRPDIVHIGFVHYEETVYLKCVGQNGDISLTDTEFISDENEQFFSPLRSPDENADLLVRKFDPYSIINCFEIFTDEAVKQIAEAFQCGRLNSLSDTAVAGEMEDSE